MCVWRNYTLRDWSIRCFLNRSLYIEEIGWTIATRLVFACRLSMPRRKAAERTHLRSRGRIALLFRECGETSRERVSRFMLNRQYVWHPLRGERVKRNRDELILAMHSNFRDDATYIVLWIAHDRNLCSRAHAREMTKFARRNVKCHETSGNAPMRMYVKHTECVFMNIIYLNVA